MQTKEALRKVWPMQMASQAFDLRAHASGVPPLISLCRGSSLFPHRVWFPTRGLPLGTDGLVPALVQSQLLLASVKVGLPQGTRLCAHTSSHEGRWQGRSLSLSFPITARFPRGKNGGYMRTTTRIEFQPLGCLAGLRPQVELISAQVGAGWIRQPC